jgi:peroxiredoxin
MEFMKKINEISKAVGKTASDTYNTVADKSGKAIEDAKLKIAISEKEEEIDEMNKKILYNKSLRECSECKEIIGVECAFCPTCGSKQKTIKFKTEKKEEKKEEVENKVCPQCGLICEANAKFCTKCGASLK